MIERNAILDVSYWWRIAALVLLSLIILLLLIFVTLTASHAGAYGKLAGEANDPLTRQWYSSLLIPDMFPNKYSCCGEADAYWADGTAVIDGQVYAIITDDRPDCLDYGENDHICRVHEDIGTRYLIPASKVVGREAHGNPTGHAIVFLTGASYVGGHKLEHPRDVLCYVPNVGG